MDNIKDNNIIIDEENCGQRFDKFLIREFSKAGKGFVYKMLRKKRVKLNGNRAAGNEILAVGDKVTLYIAPETRAALSERNADNRRAEGFIGGLGLDVVFEDANVLFVNKPAGILTHPGLTDAAEWYVQKNGGKTGSFAPVAVNRLDMNTSGLVMLAKNLPSAQELSRALRERLIDKYYMAVAAGVIGCAMTLKGRHEKDRLTNTAKISESGGKEAVTEIKPIGGTKDYTILEVRLVTGRSHQIRAHLSSIGKPVIGDTKYGETAVNKRFRESKGIKRQLLHAWRIHLSGLCGRLSYLNGMDIVCRPPAEMLSLAAREGLEDVLPPSRRP